MTDDVINSPKHYTAYPVEVIELTEHMNFNRGNAVKYIARAGLKDPSKEIEDLQKAAWYINREIQRIETLQDAEHDEPAREYHGASRAEWARMDVELRRAVVNVYRGRLRDGRTVMKGPNE